MGVRDVEVVLQRRVCHNGSVVRVSLRDVPLEVRRAEAQKPLYLTRYE
jgi:hypothetical protein